MGLLGGVLEEVLEAQGGRVRRERAVSGPHPRRKPPQELGLASTLSGLPLPSRERRSCGDGACGPLWSLWTLKTGSCHP